MKQTKQESKEVREERDLINFSFKSVFIVLSLSLLFGWIINADYTTWGIIGIVDALLLSVFIWYRK